MTRTTNYLVLFCLVACERRQDAGNHVAATTSPTPEMVHVAGGSYRLSKILVEDQPVVDLVDFTLDAREVSVAAYRACVKANACSPPATAEPGGVLASAWPGATCTYEAAGRDNHPVNCVSWHEAKAYCSFAGKRLPSSAEWEAAARGLAARTYPWGEQPPNVERLNGCGSECLLSEVEDGFRTASKDPMFGGKLPMPVAWPWKDAWPGTAPTGAVPAGATPDGIQDMAGNVSEWTATPLLKASLALLDAPPDEAVDVVFVVAGGSWISGKHEEARGDMRAHERASVAKTTIGFRCAR